MPLPPCVVFDVDGTLTATTGVDDACLVAAWRQVFALGEDLTIDTDWSKYAHSTDEGLTLECCERALARRPTRDEVARVQSTFFALLRERIAADPARCVPIRGVRELLAALASRAWKVGIASGAWEESARIKLAAAGLDDITAHLPGTFSHARDAAGRGTPAAREEIVSATLAKLGRWAGGKNAPAIYIGDGVWDAKAARNLRIGFIGVRVDGREDRLRAMGVQHIVHDFADVPAIMRAIESEIA